MLGALEVIVLVFVILGLIKLFFVLFRPKQWMSFAKGLYKNPAILMVVELVLAAIVLYYLLRSMTIVQIFGGVVLGALLTGLSLACFSKEMMAMANKVFKKGTLSKMWLSLIIWLALFIWVLIELF